jgi:selenocysteine lyase/cysteine desulfurase
VSTIEDFIADFDEDPGYLDFARVGPPGSAVRTDQAVQTDMLGRARFGTLDSLEHEDDRVREAISALVGFEPDQIAFQPTTSQGLMHAMFGISGTVALSLAEFPALTIAATRASEALGALRTTWLDTDHGRVTPGNLRDQLTPDVTAVAVSLVDFRTGYLVDLEGIRQVIGDRLLIVDAIQGFGVVDAPFELADVVVAGGQKWVRAGWGTGFLALSARAADQLSPVWSGFNATEAEDMPMDEILPPRRGAGAFLVSNPDPIAQSRFATALEGIAAVGVEAINARVAEHVSRVIDLADEYAIPVVSPRNEAERAGIVSLEPAPDQLTVLVASLHNHGVTTTARRGRIRVSPHASTDAETFGMLRASFVGFASAIKV